MTRIRARLLGTLFAVGFLMAACGQAASELNATSPLAEAAPTNAPNSISSASGTALGPTSGATPTAAAAVATSRGPNLEASDPEIVRLESGGLQLVEFFRFT